MVLRQGVELGRGGLGKMSKLGGKEDFASSLAIDVEDGTARNGGVEHFLEAKGLGTELGVVVFPFAAFAELELDGKDGAVGVFFDDVALAGEGEALRPDRESAEEGNAFDDFVAGEVGVFVDDVAAFGVLVCLAPALKDFEGGAARAIEIVVDEREREALRLARIRDG